eukprot:gene10977-11132_t
MNEVNMDDAAAKHGLNAAAECASIVRDYCKSSRPNARKLLKKLISQHPSSALPRRYLARLIYHEAAGSISPGTVGSSTSLKRIQLLQEAYEHAADATDLAPNSLSCAALRATLAINLLVEESALLNPSKSTKKGHPSGMSALDIKCQELRERFKGSIDACKMALEHPNPQMVEPVITMITTTHTTCDPCSLLQEKILEWFKSGNWGDIVAEKRSVLTSMQQVLQSCYALLDSTQVPVNSIIKLLQHILRWGMSGEKPAVTGGRASGKGRGKGRSAAAGAGAKRKERSIRERFMDVESFWRSCSPEQRMQLLQVPLAPLLEGVKAESGSEAAEELMEGLVLLREQANSSARYWMCAACNRKFYSSSDFSAHLEACHEQLAEVVGVYYSTAPLPNQQQQPAAGQSHNLCLKCFRQVSASVGAATAEQAYQRVLPHSPAVGGSSAWSDSGSEFISTRDSFSSCCEENDEEEEDLETEGVAVQLHGSRGGLHQPQGGASSSALLGREPGTAGMGLTAGAGGSGKGQVLGQQQRQLAWVSVSAGQQSSVTHHHHHHHQPPPQQLFPPAGMFVFGSQNSGQVSSSTAPLQGPAAPGAAVASEAPWSSSPSSGVVAVDAAGRLQPTVNNSGNDPLSSELIAELEAVHAARRGLPLQAAAAGPQGGEGSAAGTAASSATAAHGGQQPDTSSGSAGAAAVGVGQTQQQASSTLSSLSTATAASSSTAAANGDVADASSGSSNVGGASSSLAAATGLSSAAADSGTPTASGRTWRDWLLPKKLLQWSEESLDESGLSHGGVADQLMEFDHLDGQQTAAGQLSTASSPARRRMSADAGQSSSHNSAGTGAAAAGSGKRQSKSHTGEVTSRAGRGSATAGTLDGAAASSLDELVAAAPARGGASGRHSDVGSAYRAVGTYGNPHGASSTIKGQSLSEPCSPRTPAAVDADCKLVCEFLAAPEAAYLSPEMMRAALRCLLPGDLQMALAYVVRQHEDSLSNDGGCSESDHDSDDHSTVQEDDAGCLPLFQLHHLDEANFERLVEQIWPGQLDETEAAAAAVTQPAAANGGCIGSGKDCKGNGSSTKQCVVVDQPYPVGRKAKQQASGGSGGKPRVAPANSITSSSQGVKPVEAEGSGRVEPQLAPSMWWVEHLQQSSKAGDTAADAAADLRLLRWVFGNIASSQAEEFASRQAALRGTADRTTALFDMYEGMANAWRRMQRVADQRRVLEQLRQNIKTQFAEVRSEEESGEHCSGQQAISFLEALFTSLGGTPAGVPAPSLAAQQAAVSQLQLRFNQLTPLYLCEPAVAVVRSAPVLAQEASQRYAKALLERELAVLALIEAMLDDDVVAARQRLAAANERLLARRAELSSSEAEHARVTAEGPASHRKRDFLDKATKEAEHRERLADLKAKIDAAKGAIAEDEVTAAAADLAAADASADLSRVREQARQIAARKKNLEELSAQLATPVPPLAAAAFAAAASGAVPAMNMMQMPWASAPGSGGVAGSAAGAGISPVVAGLPADASNNSVAACAGGATAAGGGSQGTTCCPGPAAGPPNSQVGQHAAAPAGAECAPISTAAELGWSWRAQRLECLMYRVLWVAEAVKLFQAQYEPRAGGKQYELLVRASKWVKERCDAYDASFQAAAEDLSQLRSRLQQLAR